MKISQLAAAVVFAASCGVAAADAQAVSAVRPAPNPALAAIIQDYEAYLKAVDPVSAGQEGDVEAQGRLPDTSRAFELAQVQPMQAFVTRLEAVRPEDLNDAERIDHAFLLNTLRHALAGTPLDAGRLSFDSEGGPGGWALYMGQGTRLSSIAEAQAFVRRIAAFPTLYRNAIDNARRGLETGLVQPASVVDSAIALGRNDVAIAPADEPLLKPFATLPATISAADQARLRQEAQAAVESVVQARKDWLAFLTDDYRPEAPETPGLAHRKDGRALYAHLVRGHTTTDLTPDQIHGIGLSEVARIRARMETEMRAAGWTGDFAGFLAFMRSDPRFRAESREDLLEKASEMAKRADDGLPALFGTLPRLPYGVRPVPREIEDNYTTGRYNPGSIANGVAGGYMVNTSRLDQRPLYELPALTLHEAVPGHHIQIALQQEAEDQPYFRRQANVSAYTEGWGLYAEFLGEEMGFYRTPYERFGRLSYEMWRACRLVADTGLHWMGWSTEQARACFRDNSALAPHNIETELQRYIGWPGQATAYKIGEIRLRDIRARAEQQLGDRFDVRAFHDALLVDGPLPLDLLDRRMDAWIAEQP
ncbi:DUF885 family protein [Brevundimonas sp. PAMC22021]|uniref:DUF885 domain-containing protein n=1 Tax=Brevundimonas sp. PAMC22021 TaxID=2861285 RepID=UPI001C632AE0|nr:DUF885 family protein [Brevundimonas sp. PAMC22021]QYF87411.1 DUF885 family protein [Brevundimonas sp. PAMC22021]